MKITSLWLVLTVPLITGLLFAGSLRADVPVVVIESATGDGEWVDGHWYVSLYPGDTKYTTITFRNTTDAPLLVRARSNPCSLDRGNAILCFCSVSFTLEGESTYVDTLTITTSTALTSGVYVVELNLEVESPGDPAPGPAPNPDPDPDPDPGPSPDPDPSPGPGPDPDLPPDPGPGDEDGIPLWAWIVIACLGGVVVGAVVVSVIRWRRRRRLGSIRIEGGL
jgi:hypothetical protein